jgi:zinc-ribbon domain
MFCPQCGAQLSSDAVVCSACGARLEFEATAPVSFSKASGFGVLRPTTTILSALSQGKVIRNSISIVLQLGAALVLLGALLAMVQILKLSFQLQSAAATFGGVLFAILLAAALFGVSQVYLFRAQSVRELKDSPFTVIPIVSILFRAAGETYAIIAIGGGIGGCLFTWLSGSSPASLVPNLGPYAPNLAGAETGNGVFLDGLLFFAGLAVMAFISLVMAYALAEIVVVIVDIALNVRKIGSREMAIASSTGR